MLITSLEPVQLRRTSADQLPLWFFFFTPPPKKKMAFKTQKTQPKQFHPAKRTDILYRALYGTELRCLLCCYEEVTGVSSGHVCVIL